MLDLAGEVYNYNHFWLLLLGPYCAYQRQRFFIQRLQTFFYNFGHVLYVFDVFLNLNFKCFSSIYG